MAVVGYVVIQSGSPTNPDTDLNASGNWKAGDRYGENPGKSKLMESSDIVSLQKLLLNWGEKKVNSRKVYLTRLNGYVTVLKVE